MFHFCCRILKVQSLFLIDWLVLIIVVAERLLRVSVLRFCAVLCFCFCTGHFIIVRLNLTCPHCLQHSFFEHIFHFYYDTNKNENFHKPIMTWLQLFEDILCYLHKYYIILESRLKRADLLIFLKVWQFHKISYTF